MLTIDDDIYSDELDSDDLQEKEEQDNKDITDADDLLSALLSDPAIMSAAKRMFASDDAKPKHTKVTGGKCAIYTTVHQHIHCLNCGHTYIMSIKLSPKESVTISKKNGDSITYHFSIVPADGILHTYASSCSICHTIIKGWSRDELEYEYMSLLQECGASALHRLQQRRMPRFTEVEYNKEV
jgi:hypothetical protein